MEQFIQIMEVTGNGVDAVGVLIVVIGAITSTFRFLVSFWRKSEEAWKVCRQSLGRAILLGLEFLIAGDIIRTVAIAPTLENVLVLGLIVVIRTFLSFALQLELDGRWPWQRTVAQSVESTSCGTKN